MAIIELPANGWTPRHFQIPAWKAVTNPDVIKEACLAWHRRAGKDELGMQAFATNAMKRVGNYWHMLPKQDQCRIAIWESVNPVTGRVRWQEIFPQEIIAHVDNSAMQLRFKNGSTWQLKGSDNYQNLLSSQPVGICYSEAALADPAAFDFFSPILLANKGQAVYVSSVRGRNHFYKTFKSLQGKDYAFTSHLSAATSGVFTNEELEIERNRLIARRGEVLGGAIFEQEYLSNWDAAVVGAVWAAEIKRIRDSRRVFPCPYDARYPVITSWDLGVSRMDPTVILFWQSVGTEERLIDWHVGYEIGIEHYAAELADKPYFYAGHIGPHDIANREWGYGDTRINVAKRFGIDFTLVPRVKSRFENIGYGKLVLDRMIVNVTENKDPSDIHADCEHVLDALAQYPFKPMPRGHLDADGAGAYSKEPDHEHWTSHYADAVSTYGHFLAYQRDSIKRGLKPQKLQGKDSRLGDDREDAEGDKWAPVRQTNSSRIITAL